MFRIYADKNNRPAAYSPDNIPYKPKRALNISLDGVKEGDFTMVFGFPGRTNEYLHSSAIEQIVRVSDPAKIAIRTRALQVIDGFMRSDEEIKIQYAAKYANIANAWKKWQGEILGLTKTNAVAKRKELEERFEKIVKSKPERKMEYGVAGMPDYNGFGAKAGLYTSFIFKELLPFLRKKYAVPSFK